MVAADRDGAGIRFGEPAEVGGDPLDATLVVVRLRKRHVAEVVNAAGLPRGKAEGGVVAPPQGGHVANGARAEVLVALGRGVAGSVRHRDESDVARRRIGVDRAAKE